MGNQVKVNKIFGGFIAAIFLVVSGCQSTKEETQTLEIARPKIVATHSILCEFIDTIAQNTVDLTCLIQPGQDPHTYKPTPSQVQAMELAQIIFYGGYQLEPQIIQLIEATETSSNKIPVYEEVVTQPILAEHEHHEAEHDHEEEEHKDHSHEHEHEEEYKGHDHEQAKVQADELEPDPHVWHDVKNAIATVEYLQLAISEINPTQASLYSQNGFEYIEQLQQLEPWIKKQIATIPENNRLLITTHNALNYYVQAYGLKDYQSLQGLSTEDAPTAADVRNLVTEIGATGVPTIFAEVRGNDRVINNVAREAGVKISDRKLLTDGIGKPGTDTDSYLKMMTNNTCAIVEGLGGECEKFK